MRWICVGLASGCRHRHQARAASRTVPRSTSGSMSPASRKGDLRPHLASCRSHGADEPGACIPVDGDDHAESGAPGVRRVRRAGCGVRIGVRGRTACLMHPRPTSRERFDRILAEAIGRGVDRFACLPRTQHQHALAGEFSATVGTAARWSARGWPDERGVAGLLAEVHLLGDRGEFAQDGCDGPTHAGKSTFMKNMIRRRIEVGGDQCLHPGAQHLHDHLARWLGPIPGRNEAAASARRRSGRGDMTALPQQFRSPPSITWTKGKRHVSSGARTR